MTRSDEDAILLAHAIRRTSPSAIGFRYLRIDAHVIDCDAAFSLDVSRYSVVAMSTTRSHLPIRSTGHTVADTFSPYD